MSWDAFLETGSGRVGLRLSGEGLGYEFVSSQSMEVTTSEGRQRVAVLKHDGIGWMEKANILQGTLDVSGFTARLIDRQRDAVLTKAFAWQPSVKTWLNADVAVVAATVTVLSTTGIIADDVIHLGTEAMLVVSVASGTVLNVTRAYWGTIAQAHYTADGERLAHPVVSVSRPLSIEGRRFNLFAYGVGDDPTGDGTLIFRGVAATDASLEPTGSEWHVTIDSITRLMDSPIGGDLENEVGSRGIYYSWSAPLTVLIQEATSTTETLTVVIPSTATPQAFFETQEEFTQYLTEKIVAAASSFAGWFASGVVAVSGGADDWWLEVTLGGTPTPLTVQAWSAIDGVINEWFLPGGEATGGRTANTTYEIRAGAGSAAADVPAEILRRVPRGMYGTGTVTSPPADVVETAVPGKIYINGSVAIGDLTAVRIDGTNGDSAYLRIRDQSATEGWVEMGFSLDGEAMGSFGYGLGNDVSLRFIRELGIGDVSIVRDAVVTDSPTEANLGNLPFLTTDDLASWTAKAAEAARGRAWAAQRRYIVDEESTFAEYIAPELLGVGLFPITDSDGKIALERMRSPASTEPTTLDIDGAVVVIDEGFPRWERNAWGRINQVEYSWGYDPGEEEHRGTIVVRDVQAFSESKAGNSIEVAPKSEPVSGQPSYGELVGLAWPYLGIFGRSYAIVRGDAKMPTYFRALLGAAVTLTLPDIPNQTTGERGVTSVSGILVERGVRLDAGRASFGVLVVSSTIAGYAPTLQIDSFVDNGGSSYTLTVSDANPLDATLDMTLPADDVSDHWRVGDSVSVSASATTTAPLTGSVTAVTATTITAVLASAPTGKDLIHYSLASVATSSQRDYIYQATDLGRIAFTVAEQAKEYAP